MPFRSPFKPCNDPANDITTANAVDAYIDWIGSSDAACEFFLARRKVEPALLEALASRALQAPMVIPYVRARMIVNQFEAGTTHVNLSAMLQGSRPDVVVRHPRRRCCCCRSRQHCFPARTRAPLTRSLPLAGCL